VSATQADTIDLREIFAVIRRGWRQILVFAGIGVLVAGASLIWAPRRFESAATVVVRNSPDLTGAVLSRIGLGDAGAGAGILSSAAGSSIETDLQILSSRVVASEVVDSLLLRARVTAPAGFPASRVVESLDLRESFKPVKYRFARAEGGYRVRGVRGTDGRELVATPGRAFRLPEGTVTLSSLPLPEEFTIQLLDREDAVRRTLDRLRVGKKGGEVIRVAYRAPDSLTAAAVPNAVVGAYLARKRTSDRGVNRERAEFLEQQLDSIEVALTRAEELLRNHQEASGVIEPVVVGRLQLERAGEIRKQLGELDVERAAVSQMLAEVASGGMTPRQIAAYPTFLKSGGLGSLLDRMSELEAKRQELLGNRTEEDPEVIALREGIRGLEEQLVPMATAYQSALDRQRSDVARQLDTMRVALATLPGATQMSVRLQRDVMRMGQIHGALQAQLVEARLAAISEGGDVRRLDPAGIPKKVAFPGRGATIGLGLGGGLILGILSALLSGTVGRYIDDPYSIERVTGVPTLRLEPQAPLLFSGRPLSKTVLVIPLDDRSDTAGVAQRLARTALSRSTGVTVLDLSEVGNGTVGGVENVAATIERLEQENAMVVVRLPGLASDATAAALRETRPVLLVGPEARLDRERLMSAVQTLRRLEIPCAGVVLSGPGSGVLAAG
jgi:uncharacterized protein involved in exopolysaccharide biosynthesis